MKEITVQAADSVDILDLYKKVLVDHEDEYDSMVIDMSEYDYHECDVRLMKKLKDLARKKNLNVRFTH